MHMCIAAMYTCKWRQSCLCNTIKDILLSIRVDLASSKITSIRNVGSLYMLIVVKVGFTRICVMRLYSEPVSCMFHIR